MSGEQKWLTGLRSTSLFRTPPIDVHDKQSKILAYVDLFGQFASDTFAQDIAELIRENYPQNEMRLLDDVLATFILYHPENASAILYPLVCVLREGVLTYSKDNPPFSAFLSIFAISCTREMLDQWALACEEILRQLTQHNYSAGSRFLKHWITDSLLSAPDSLRRSYFRWCSGSLRSYGGGSLITDIISEGADAILSVCDDEVARYRMSELTSVAIPALFLPSSSAVASYACKMPCLRPYERLLYRYYSVSASDVTRRLLFGILEAPSSWAPHALDAALELLKCLHAAEDAHSPWKLPDNWVYVHFLRPLGAAALSMEETCSFHAAVGFLVRFFSEPMLLFPRGMEHADQHFPVLSGSNEEKEANRSSEMDAAKCLASFMLEYGVDAERKMCTLWEVAFGLNAVGLSSVTQPPCSIAAQLTWDSVRPLLRILAVLPRERPSYSCLRRILMAGLDAAMSKSLLREEMQQTSEVSLLQNVSELENVIHYLFTEALATPAVVAQLSDALVACLLHDNRSNCRRATGSFDSYIIRAVCGLSSELELCILSSDQPRESTLQRAKKLIAVLKGLLETEQFALDLQDLPANNIAAAHVSKLLRGTEACRHALTAVGRCKLDPALSAEASTLFALLVEESDTAEVKCSSPNAENPVDMDKWTDLAANLTPQGESPILLNASDLANLLYESKGVSSYLNAVLKVEESALSVVQLLWQKLMVITDSAPVVDAICSVAAMYPEKVASIIFLQAEIELQCWLTERWSIICQIVHLLRELLRMVPKVFITAENACSVLYKATDAIALYGEACVVPQLELLEAVTLAMKSSHAGPIQRDFLLLLKKRLSAIVSCLSHSSSRVRGMSAALLRELASIDSDKSSCWMLDIERSLVREARFRRAAGLSEVFLVSTATSVGCQFPAKG